MAARLQGTIKVWDQTKGFGYVRSDDGQEFLATVASLEMLGSPSVGQRVEFEVHQTRKGTVAINIKGI